MNPSRAQISVERFQRLAETHLDILDEHEKKIKHCRDKQDWNSASREELNAQRTVSQLVSDFRQIISLLSDLRPEDQAVFQERLKPLQNRIRITVERINTLINETSSEFHSNSDTDSTSGPKELVSQVQIQTLRKRAEHAHQEAEAHEQLSRDILDLQTLMQDLAALVQVQHDVVDSIEQHVENAEEDLKCGEKDLKQAGRYKAASYPLIGGLIGAAAGGPVGLLIGLKVAVVGAVGGGLLGVFGGKYMRTEAGENVTEVSRDSETIPAEQK